jgi:hypothetical protein
MCAFAMERSKGVFVAGAATPFNSHCPNHIGPRTKIGRTLGGKRINQSQEFYMSARNGDKSRFNRERKQKIARRKRTLELLERAAKARKSADATARAQLRSVSA